MQIFANGKSRKKATWTCCMADNSTQSTLFFGNVVSHFSRALIMNLPCAWSQISSKWKTGKNAVSIVNIINIWYVIFLRNIDNDINVGKRDCTCGKQNCSRPNCFCLFDFEMKDWAWTTFSKSRIQYLCIRLKIRKNWSTLQYFRMNGRVMSLQATSLNRMNVSFSFHIFASF